MEYIYAAMLIHKCSGTVDETNLKKVIEAAGGKPDEGKIKSVVAAMKNVDIEKAIKEAAVPVVTAAPIGEAPAEKKEEKKEEKEEEQKEDPEKAAAGLGALFG